MRYNTIMPMLIKKSKPKIVKKGVFGGLLVGFGVILAFSLHKIYLWQQDSHEIQQIMNEIIVDTKDNGGADAVIDWAKLSSANPDTVAWLSVPGTEVNYPVVQTGDNDYYLDHSFEKKYNRAGWIFADYRNNLEDFDQNNIIYGHGYLTGVMFGTLRNVLGRGWQLQPENHLIKLSTPTQETSWKVFSVYQIKTTSDYLDIAFGGDEEFADFLGLITERSFYNFGDSPTTVDRILTLSTCYNYQDKTVVHAKLIE